MNRKYRDKVKEDFEMTEITSRRNSEIDMLIRFYNMKTGLACRVTNEINRAETNKLIEAADGDVELAKTAIKRFLADDPINHNETVNSGMARAIRFLHKDADVIDTTATPVMDVKQIPADTSRAADNKAIVDGLGLMEQAVVNLIANMQQTAIEQKVLGGVEKTVREFIAKEYGPIERKITAVIDGQKRELNGVQHEKFDTILKFVANNEPVFLTGPAGSGKNVLCKQIADALELPFYFTNAVTQEYKLTGFTDANGNYQPTQFYKAFKDGGVFMLDEMDASIPEVLIILNAAIANRYFDFPAPIGYVEAHPNFRVIAAGNTFGTGADYDYVGRNQLDMASLDRFALIRVDYSPKIEESVANGDTELVGFCRDFRKAAEKAGVKALVSYRAIGRIAKMAQVMSLEDCLESCLVKGMEHDDLNAILGGMPNDSKYKQALYRLKNRMHK